MKTNRRAFAFFPLIFVIACSSTPVEKTASRAPATSSDYMVATQGYWTSLAAKEILEKGGNAIDAAVAASFAIAVERPQSTGIGGGGFMMIGLTNGEVKALDFREKAPKGAHQEMFLDAQGKVIPNRSTQGAWADAVPGMVAGVIEAKLRYGSKSLTLHEVMEPAIRLAENGFEVYPHLAEAIETQADLIKKFPATEAIFFKNGKPLREGDILKQHDLAMTLKKIAKEGRLGFYSGKIADLIVAESKRIRGKISRMDLSTYKPAWREPVKGTYRDFTVYSMPPSSSGGIHLIQILNILEPFELRKKGPFHPDSVHLTASAMQRAYADRSKFLGDPDFVKVPVQGLTSKEYAADIRKQMNLQRAQSQAEVQPGNPAGPYESSETTHFTIADKYGNIVSTTQTINGWMGSGVVVPGAGFLLNNEMDDFSAKPGEANKFGVVGGFENSIAPGKRPLSSMSPTIAYKNGKVDIALGTPAGSRIITCVALTFLNYAEYEMPLAEAVAAPRYHQQWTPDEIEAEKEPKAFSDSLKKELEGRGHKIAERGIGCKMEAIAKKDGQWIGVSDKRGEGLAIGAEPAPPVPHYDPPKGERWVPAD